MTLPRLRGEIRRFIFPGLLVLFAAVTALTDPRLQTAHAASLSAKQVAINWGAKDTSFKQLLEEKTPILYPTYLPKGFQQTAVKKVWVVKDTGIHMASGETKAKPRVPARKVIFISYTKTGNPKAEIFLFQTHAIKDIETRDNIYPAFGQGYFITEMKIGDDLRHSRIGSQDYLLVFRGVTGSEIPQIEKSLKQLDRSDTNK